jgi:hypothetical protein
MSDRRKLDSSVFLLTVVSALLILPPIVYIFNKPFSHFGVPQVALYLFCVWVLMIAATALATRWLPKAGRTGDREGGS